jgi:hypothetical protein
MVARAMLKIDVSREVEELGHVLRSRTDPIRCGEAIAILRRWRFDEMLDEPSREQASRLVLEFESSGWRRRT